MTGAPPLTADDFAAIFQTIHGVPPFPWQARLAHQLADGGDWPAALDLPTGSGKTAALDIALFHLALQAERGAARTAPVRIAFVVDRRIIVDAAHERARKIADALESATESATDGALGRMAAALRSLSGGGPPLVVQALRGGLPREGDWARTPAQPTVLCSTVDQVGSRLLFRGYGVSDSMKPVHAGLLGADCLLLLDEAHLAAPFAQTLGWVDRYRRPPWTKVEPPPWRVVTLTATPRGSEQGAKPFGLCDDDRADETLSKRLAAAKPATLRLAAAEANGPTHAKALAEAATDLLDRDRPRTLAVVVNRVALARGVFETLRAAMGDDDGTPPEEQKARVILLTGRVRELDRATLLKTHQERLLSGAEDPSDALPLIVVATQTIEAGADFDFDAMVTQIAPLDALRQRFGRLNRTGRPIPASAVIVAAKDEVAKKADDAVYGDRARATWDWLATIAAKPASKKDAPVVDFGLTAMAARLDGQDVTDLCSTSPDAPILRPADVTLLSWTAPVPAVDPAVSLFLHGPKSGPADVQIVWRADIDPDDPELATELLALVPPHAGETLAVPVWAARRWLRHEAGAADTADIEGAPDPDEDRGRHQDRPAVRWAGADSARTKRVWPGQIRPGDVIVVPAAYGGCDAFGWSPESPAPVADLGDHQPSHRRAVRRLHRDLSPDAAWSAAGPFVAPEDDTDDRDVREALTGAGIGFLPADPADPDASERPLGDADVIRLDGYGGLILRARRRGTGAAPAAVTENDATGSLTGAGLTLQEHAEQVEGMARAFAQAAGLSSDLTEAVALAARLHDEGKADPRFQVWLHGGDRLAALAAEKTPLAKSSRPMTRAQSARARTTAGLPDLWRHESDSVRRATGDARLAALAHEDEKKDLRGLVLWLIGTHHGHGRPLFPHADPPADARYPGGTAGPHCLDFQHDGRDWPQLFAHLTDRFGPWALARLEAIVRLADHRASEAAEKEPTP
ncbi:type I-G CRISPR-associated helicase/endonuclease Cas3g [Roseospira navarrensis]|uniref:Type I-U CRISPR-associated helicase/endonuclease Cas3 n=1 Tax=Roseospira navarrensis TaxID=140058 RepID=A0A7X1ZHB8_9PROT|nr:type I-U CRISPR-associated helicase/endonuclease Cas3 [Roseospira navarrensis]MQX38253.1 type I-U CRISPR-associated helicase/endonuclease Cas3 [Roseospira navarrensis]